jgi:hypothetical protein
MKTSAFGTDFPNAAADTAGPAARNREIPSAAGGAENLSTRRSTFLTPRGQEGTGHPRPGRNLARSSKRGWSVHRVRSS